MKIAAGAHAASISVAKMNEFSTEVSINSLALRVVCSDRNEAKDKVCAQPKSQLLKNCRDCCNLKRKSLGHLGDLIFEKGDRKHNVSR